MSVERPFIERQSTIEGGGSNRKPDTQSTQEHKGKPFSAETRAKMSKAKKGKKRKPFSAEHKARISAGHKKEMS